MSKWDILFYNFIVVVDLFVIAALIQNLVRFSIANFYTAFKMNVETYYEHKKKFLVEISKEAGDDVDQKVRGSKYN
jgi:hypothetical protein